MQFPSSPNAEGWRARRPDLPRAPRDADDVSPPLRSRQRHALAAVALGALGSGAGLSLLDDPRPLDVQLSSAMRQAGQTLKDWQGQLSRGLHESLRAVADGRDPPAKPHGR